MTRRFTQLGEITCFLGIRVRKGESEIYSLSQKSFIRKLIKRFGKKGVKGFKYPMDSGYFKLSKDGKKLEACAGVLSRKVSCPSEVDWTESQRNIRYLANTVDYRLGNMVEKFELVGYCDAEWAGDYSNRKSCSRFMFRLQRATVLWASRKQSCATLPIMKAKYVSLSEAAHEVV